MSRRAHPWPVIVLLSLLVGACHAEPPPEQKDADKKKGEYGALKFRLIGPAIGGRIARVTGVPSNPDVFYFAAAQGGVWKSEDAGKSFKPLMDDVPLSGSMGAVALAPSDPNVIYAGGGEANPRGNVMVGWGIWKSTDAGRNWTHLWKNKGQIGTLEVDPRNADIAYAAVLGSPFGPSDSRGVYRTQDGGKSWTRVLYKDADTGASDVTLDPHNPRILYAGLWQMRRQPWTMTSGGPGSGLYRSGDGGDTWTRLEAHGLPDGVWGKVGVRIAPSDSNRIYALIEAAEGGLFRSDDGGTEWKRVSSHRALRQRAWYYTVLTIDPRDPDTVWFPSVPLLRTTDGGKTVSQVIGPHHGDHHDIWIDPRDPRRMISGNDGGVDISTDAGKTWFNPDLALGQFYNIDVDDRTPWYTGGTIQDWGTASGPNSLPKKDGVVLSDWRAVGGGEAGDFKYDPLQPGRIYASEYGGYVSQYDEGTGQYRQISMYPVNTSGLKPRELEYRFQWTSPLEISPHDAHVLYHGANVLLRSADRGETWQAISPDLTRNDDAKLGWSGGPLTGDITGVETYDTIFAITESPRAAGMIWVGTDDGKVQLTSDGGANWRDVTPRAMPEWGTVEHIEASTHDANTAYVVVDARRMDDQRPYLFRTTDAGASWQAVSGDLPQDQPLFVLRVDPVDPQLLYAGGERGLWLSRDGGSHWGDVKQGLPPVGVADIEIRHGALVLGTRRGIWSLDDLQTLRSFVPAVVAKPLHLFAPAAAVRWRLDTAWGDQGQIGGPAYGVNFSYWLKESPKEEISAEILDASGTVLRKLSSVLKPLKYTLDDPDSPDAEDYAKEPPKPELSKEQGLNTATWNLRMEGAKRIASKVDAGDPESGPLVAPGKYLLRLHAAGQTEEQPIEVLPDPRSPATPEQLQVNVAFAVGARDAMNRVLHDVELVQAIREQAAELRHRTEANEAAGALRASAEAAMAKCDAIEHRLHNPQAEVFYDVLGGREGGAQMYGQFSPLAAWIQEADYPPTQGMRERFEFLQGELERVEQEIAALRSGELAKLEQDASALALPRVILPP